MNTVATIENITPAKAAMWIDENFASNRPINKQRILHYANEMRNGAWNPSNTIAFAVLNNKRILVNGQHTLLSVRESGVTLKQNPIVKHYVISEDEVKTLYAHYDIGKSRTYSDSLTAYGIPEKIGLTKGLTNKLSAAAMYIQAGFPTSASKPIVSHEDTIQFVYKYLDEFTAIRNAISPCDSMIRSKIESKGIMSIAMITYKYQPSRALDFWQSVAQLNELSGKDPRLALHKSFIKMSVGRNTGEFVRYKTVAFARVSAYAWNKWMTDLPLSYVKPTTAMKMKKIKLIGTPYNGVNNPE